MHYLGRDAFLEAEPPEFVPAMTDLLHGDGYVFARRYATSGSELAAWWVFDPDGVWLGALDLPADMTVWELGPDHVLGKITDALGVERVVVHGVAPANP